MDEPGSHRRGLTQPLPRLARTGAGPVGLLGRWLPLVVAGGVGLVLIGSALFVRAAIADASTTATHGQGEALALASRLTWRQRRALPDQAALEAFLAAHRDEGLRYVGLAAPGPGPIVAAAGRARGTSRMMGEVIDLGERVRLINPIMSHRPPHPGPPSHLRGEHPPPHHHPGGKRPPPPPPHHHPQGKRPPPSGGPLNLILEYEPLPARKLARQANTQLAVAGATAAVVLLLALGLTRSLSQREALRLQLERDRRLAALGEMSAVLAHELRNPLASLKGNAQLLVELLEGGSGKHDKATRVVRESVRLEQLINDLLAFVRSGELQLAPTSPRALLARAVDEIGDDRLEIESAGEQADLPWPLDRDRMQQALANVLQNALQATSGGERVRAAVRVSDAALVFTVEDEGDGIPADEVEQIFEPFHTGRVRGTGLGLAITRRIVELHGGTIRADNRPGPASGARVTISIPAAVGRGHAAERERS